MSLSEEVDIYLREETLVLFLHDSALDDIMSLEACDFVFSLAFRCLEHEAEEATGPISKQQVAFVLERLQGIAAETEKTRKMRGVKETRF